MASLTKIELEGLHYMFNLGDAHTRKLQLKEYDSIINTFGNKFDSVDLQNYYTLRQEFLKEYFRLIGQTYKYEQTLLSYASSISMEVIANFLRLYNLKKMALVEPTFDNIPDILYRHGIELIPFGDHENYRILLEKPELYHNLNAIFVTVPNNPTGEIITKEALEIICSFCFTNNVLLIVDACFRLFSPQMLSYDMREICEKSNIDYIIIEDTGKYWPLHDLKIGIIVCSRSLFDKLNDVHCDFMLNVSPFILSILKDFACLEMKLKSRPVLNVIKENRNTLKRALETMDLETYNSNSTVSVEFINTSKLHKDSNYICQILKSGGVITLPGEKFYWSGNGLGEKYMRIALARIPEYFEQSVRRMMEIMCKSFPIK
ncbi:MAG: pyridoxal phosphate-dependent aminotransferase [Ignavibacteriales bacterium]|nr:pyridoxal phosphate-dependent aminotransferase [Ignavibacteriales bacterium]